MINLIEKARAFNERKAIISDGQGFSYQQLLEDSAAVAHQLLNGQIDLHEARIAFLVDPSYDYTRLQWGIWRAGGIAVPLCTKHPLPSIEYVLNDTKAAIVLYSKAYQALLQPLFGRTAIQFIQLADLGDEAGPLPDIGMDRRAMILYTSGTTGSPKGVVSTHAAIEAQITALTVSWYWEQDDHILNILPLHHVHGIINVMSCALYMGACCEFLPKFDPNHVFQAFERGTINVFMAVPTIYYKLIAYWKQLPTERQEVISQALSKFRLMVSGSAALPVSVLEQWQMISGHTLLERYGMTEMGMAISNPYHGERRPGYIGQPLNKVTIRIADEKDEVVPTGSSGEIQVKGPNVFSEYWEKPEATQNTFTEDGWFKTGDIALLHEGYYRILGRNSVDIIKSGGYKISALEVEEVLRTHPSIDECGVVGIPDEEWGEIVAASLILNQPTINFDSLTTWLKERLPGYKCPRKYIIQDDLPRNVMGKVTKKALQKIIQRAMEL